MGEGVDTSYTKYHDQIDNDPYEKLHPPEGTLCRLDGRRRIVNMTVNVEHPSTYTVDLLSLPTPVERYRLI